MSQSGQVVAPSGIAMGDDNSLIVLSELINLLADAIYVVALEGPGSFRFALVNEAFASGTGKTQESLVGHPPHYAFGPQQGEEMARRWYSVVERGSATRQRAEIDDMVIDTILTPMFDLDGRCTHLIGVARNITHESQEGRQLKSLFSHATEGVAILDERAAVAEVIFGGLEVWGRSPAELGGCDFASIIHPEDREHFQEVLHRALLDPDVIHGFEVRSQRCDGRWRWSKGVLCNLMSDRAVGGIGLTIRDCHERREVEKSLEELEAKFRDVVSNVSDALVGINLDQEIVIWNRAAEEMFGYTASEILHQSLSVLIPEEMRAAHAVSVREFVSAGTNRVAVNARESTLDIWAVDRDGKTFPVEIGLSRIPSRDGPILMASIRDVTERKKAQAAMAQAMEDLQTAQSELVQAQKLESVGQLAAGVAHEINTPMQYIGDNTHFLKATVTRLLGVAEAAERVVAEDATEADTEALVALLKRSKLPMLAERAPKAADDALSGVENVSRIVAAMKRFSHPGSDEMEPVDLNEAIVTTMTVCRNEWKYSAEIETNLDPDLPLIQGRLGPLNQVWLNTIVNATHAVAERHGDSKGVITITTETADDGEAVKVHIADNGIGIPEENLNRIFDHFFTTKDVGKGTGQGLSLVHRVIVGDHRGSITVDSTPGEGTTFTITLPVTQPIDRSSGDAAEQ